MIELGITFLFFFHIRSIMSVIESREKQAFEKLIQSTRIG